MRRYVDNADLNELLNYSGAGERLRRRQIAADRAAIDRARDELSRRMAEVERAQRPAREPRWYGVTLAVMAVGVLMMVGVLLYSALRGAERGTTHRTSHPLGELFLEPQGNAPTAGDVDACDPQIEELDLQPADLAEEERGALRSGRLAGNQCQNAEKRSVSYPEALLQRARCQVFDASCANFGAPRTLVCYMVLHGRDLSCGGFCRGACGVLSDVGPVFLLSLQWSLVESNSDPWSEVRYASPHGKTPFELPRVRLNERTNSVGAVESAGSGDRVASTGVTGTHDH